MAPAPEHA
jgi:hypothetical protein